MEDSLYDDHKHKEGLGDVEQILRDELNTNTLRTCGNMVSGSINDGMAYETDFGTVFVKFNAKSEDGALFEGEFESLKALWDTQTLTVPRPIKFIRCPAGGSMLVLNYLPMQPITTKNFAILGQQAARLHLHNSQLKKRSKRLEQTITQKGECPDYIDQYGFHVPTHCGYFAQNNDWLDSWEDFFARKLQDHVTMTEEKFNSREARPLFNRLMRVMPQLFKGLEIEPSLLHGDLWRGNIKETYQGPVAFDPISFYGHSEFEISIAHCHQGFEPCYFESYHSVIPKATGFEDRLDLYLLHHYFQLWNHYGPTFNPNTLREVESHVHGARFSRGYDLATLNQMRKILDKFE